MKIRFRKDIPIVNEFLHTTNPDDAKTSEHLSKRMYWVGSDCVMVCNQNVDIAGLIKELLTYQRCEKVTTYIRGEYYVLVFTTPY